MSEIHRKNYKSIKQKDIETVEIKEFCDKLDEKICYSEGIEMLNEILLKIPNSNLESCQTKRHSLIHAVFNSLLKIKVTSNHVDSIINRIAVEFAYCGKNSLLKLVDFCLARIQNNDDDNTCWKDLLPLLLQTLKEEKYINHKGNEFSGLEYKSKIVETICLIKWDFKLLTSLAKMFREMALEKSDLELVMRSLCDALLKTEVGEIPPLVHQLLRLTDDSRLLLNTLRRYFSQKYGETSQESGEDCDIIGIIDVKDVKDSESTVLYHIYQAVQMDQKIFKLFLRYLKSVINKPEFVLDTFTISVFMSNVNIFKDQVFEVLKLSIVRKYHEEERSKNSLWLRNLVPNEWRVIDVFGEVINNSVQDRTPILENLLEFSFYLMGIEKKIGHDDTAILWEVGAKVVQKITKKVQGSGITVLQYLSEKIISNENSFLQYTDCLSYMCRKLTLVVIEHLALITSLLEQLLSKAGSDVMPVVSAILPLLKISQRVRDTFVLVLRKALTKSDIYLRKMAVLGFLELLKNLKITSLSALSQSNNCSSSTSTSSCSIITQATLEKNVSNLAQDPRYNMSLCHELLSILRRCLMYDCQVRLYLYQGIYDVVVANMELAEYVTEMLLDHFMVFYEPNESICPPIIFDKSTMTQGAEEVLLEPLGELIYLIQKLYIKTALKNYAAINKFSIILESLCKRISSIEAEHLNLDEATDLLENVPKAQKTLHHLKLTISVCEALIAYRFGSWSKDSLQIGQNVNSLFRTYIRFVDFFKRSNKVKKSDPKKTDKDVTDRSMIRKNARAVILKLPNTVMDVHTVNRMLSLLYETDLSWASKEEVEILRKRVEFNNYALQTCLQLIHNSKALKGNSVKEHKDKYSRTFILIGRLLFTNIISKLDEVQTVNPGSSFYAVECFKELCNLMCNVWTSELPMFLSITGGVDVKEGRNVQIEAVLTPLKNQFNASLQVEKDDDLNFNKVSLYLIETISYFVHKMTFASNLTNNNIQDWLKTLAATKINESSICLIMFELMLFVDIQTTDHGEIFLRNICNALCDKFSEDNHYDTGEYEIINNSNFMQISCAVNKTIKSKLQDVVLLFSRLKAKQILICTPGMKNDEQRSKIKNTERSICTQLASIARMLDSLSQIKTGHGLYNDALLKNIHQIFNTLSNLTKYFINKSNEPNLSFDSTKFSMLVEIAGKTLKPRVESYIYTLEENKKSQSKSSDLKGRRNKILKETKLIPRVIYEIEQFNKDILSLSKKSKIDLNKNIKPSYTRDFSIKKKELVQNLERIDMTMHTTQNTTHRTSRIEDESLSNENSEASKESENEVTTPKRRKLDISSES